MTYRHLYLLSVLCEELSPRGAPLYIPGSCAACHQPPPHRLWQRRRRHGGRSPPGTDTEDNAGQDDTDTTETDDETPNQDDESDDGINRPDITLPDDVNNVFEEPTTDDPVELAVLADMERRINAVDEAVTSGSANNPALTFYTTDEAFISSLEYISGMHDDNLSFAGTTRYYARGAELLEDGTAVSKHCMDGSESYTYDISSGDEDQSAGRHYMYRSHLTLNGEGVWQTTHFTVEGDDPSCDG